MIQTANVQTNEHLKQYKSKLSKINGYGSMSQYELIVHMNSLEMYLKAHHPPLMYECLDMQHIGNIFPFLLRRQVSYVDFQNLLSTLSHPFVRLLQN